MDLSAAKTTALVGSDSREQGATQKGTNYNFQVQEVAILSPRISHEARFRINSENESTVPLNAGPHIEVPDAFRGGGSTDSESSTDRQIDFGNLLMYTAADRFP